MIKDTIRKNKQHTETAHVGVSSRDLCSPVSIRTRLYNMMMCFLLKSLLKNFYPGLWIFLIIYLETIRKENTFSCDVYVHLSCGCVWWLYKDGAVPKLERYGKLSSIGNMGGDLYIYRDDLWYREVISINYSIPRQIRKLIKYCYKQHVC